MTQKVSPDQLPSGIGIGEGAPLEHVQGTPASIWVVTYPTGITGYPDVNVLDTTGRKLWVSWKYNSNQQLEICFAFPTIGKAYIKF